MKAGDNCIHISGAHNTIENVITHGCDDTGIQITADGSQAADNTRAAHNLILNCDSYENYDSQNAGENADGFAAKLYIGPGNVFRGCRAWNNSDDGWDLFASNDVVVIENSWAIANGKIGAAQNNTNGDGNGFKLGGAAKDQYQGGAEHVVKGCASIGNRACGYTLNNNTQTPKLSGPLTRAGSGICFADVSLDQCREAAVSLKVPAQVLQAGAAQRNLPASAWKPGEFLAKRSDTAAAGSGGETDHAKHHTRRVEERVLMRAVHVDTLRRIADARVTVNAHNDAAHVSSALLLHTLVQGCVRRRALAIQELVVERCVHGLGVLLFCATGHTSALGCSCVFPSRPRGAVDGCCCGLAHTRVTVLGMSQYKVVGPLSHRPTLHAV